jgi:ATP-dependent helicase/DNAse subunit B
MISLSYSAAQKYLTSPFAYFAHYFLRLRPTTTGSALIFGSALDEGFNSLLENKRDGVEPDLGLAQETFTSAMTKHRNAQVRYSKADIDPELELSPADKAYCPSLGWHSLNKKGRILIEEYYTQVMPKLEKVILVQHNINLENANGDKLTGVIDLVATIDGKTYIIDNKSTSKAYTANSANESPQLATYFEALRADYKLDGVAYITVPKTLRKRKKPVVDISIIFGEASEDLIEKTFTEYDEVLSGIRQGKFVCSPEKCCSTPWGCDYRNYCESGGKDLSGLVVVEKSNRK